MAGARRTALAAAFAAVSILGFAAQAQAGPAEVVFAQFSRPATRPT